MALWAVSFDSSINLGSVLNLIGFVVLSVGAWFTFKSRVDTVLANQKELMDKLTERFEHHEQTDRESFSLLQLAVTKLVGDVSRVIGHVESRSRTRGDS